MHAQREQGLTPLAMLEFALLGVAARVARKWWMRWEEVFGAPFGRSALSPRRCTLGPACLYRRDKLNIHQPHPLD